MEPQYSTTTFVVSERPASNDVQNISNDQVHPDEDNIADRENHASDNMGQSNQDLSANQQLVHSNKDLFDDVHDDFTQDLSNAEQQLPKDVSSLSSLPTSTIRITTTALVHDHAKDGSPIAYKIIHIM